MRFAGDLHIHSHYSRATSRDLTPENLDFWGRTKGISVIGTGDFTHPGWVAELKEKLEPAEEGLFSLKGEYRIESAAGIPPVAQDGQETRFLLTSEISSIYKYGERVRKVHNVVFAPDFSTVERIQKKIERLGGNIRSDGRPILGLDSRDLLELCLEADERIFFVPAHIWTPWFSALGSKSGFDSIKECFRDLSDHIFAVETGLSSDPPMNWMCSFLDEYTLISNSDAHSPEKLGREACLFDTGLTYTEIIEAMRRGSAAGFRGTIEFFPQEGKYHFDGHRKCSISWDPLETLEHRGICPACGRPVTVGVLNRVAQLADREVITDRSVRDPFYSLIPLKELLAELEGVGAGSKRVKERYLDCLGHLGPELDILLSRDPSDIARMAGEGLAEAIERMRGRQVRVTAGYDGEYGTIRIWDAGDPPPERRENPTPSLFGQVPLNAALDDASPSDQPLFDTPPSSDPASAGLRLARSPSAGGASPAGNPRGPKPLELVEFNLAAYQARRADVGIALSPAAASVEGPSSAAEREISPGYGEAGERGDRPTGELNEEQQKAADYSGGPSLIIAGPGTGKTRTMVAKIRRLVLTGTEPGTIVAVTFTNKAADELRGRLLSEGVPVGGGASTGEGGSSGAVRVSTFHGFGLSILKQHLHLLGRDEDFLILDDDDKESLLVAEGVSSAAERRALIELASRIKSGATPLAAGSAPDLGRFREFQEMLKRHNCFDYDDLVYLPLRLFEKRSEILEEVRRRIDHLIIDEYQDINPAQYTLVRALSEDAEVCAVGDPNQSIYGFRGSSPEFIERFFEDFHGAKRFSLSTSYRCPDTLLRASSQVLGSEVALLGIRPGVKINILRAPSAASEAEQIARDIEVRTGGVGFFSIDSDVVASTDSAEVAPADVAVLCRTSMQMPALEKAFIDHRIPFRTIHTESHFGKEPYRSFLNFVRILLRRREGEELPFGAVKNVGRKLLAEATLPEGRRETLALFAHLYHAGRDEPSAGELVDTMDAEIAPYWGDREDGAAFVEHARLGSGLDRYDPRLQTITLLTIHAAKGLEFDVVYVPGCEDSLIPYTLSGDEGTNMEEERRLLYVAMTRARQSLFLSYSLTRTIFGKTRNQQESPFLAAIEQALLDRQSAELEQRSARPNRQLSLFE